MGSRVWWRRSRSIVWASRNKRVCGIGGLLVVIWHGVGRSIPSDDILVCFVVCIDRCGWASVRVLLLDFDEVYDWAREKL
jgi:hypothetical protein